MGGSVKNIASTVGRVGSGVFTLGGSEIARNNLGASNPLSQALQIPGTIMTGGAGGPGNMPSVFGTNRGNPYVSGPFSLDPNQVAADSSAIKGLGAQQYQDTLGAIDTNSAAQQQYAGDTINRMLPGIYEDMNARHLLTSSATGQEVGRQASYLGQDLASQRANAIQQALVGKQGFDTGALQRGLSLEDFVNQANVAKTIGAQLAPQVGNGKGTAVAGLGAGAAAGAPFGPWGSAAGAGLGTLLGSNRSGK